MDYKERMAIERRVVTNDDLVEDMWREAGSYSVTLYDYRCIVKDVELKHNIKEKP